MVESKVWILYWFAVFTAPTDAAYKRWVPNTNFDNPVNWDGGRLPCPNDAIQFPETSSPILMKNNISTREVVLPINGELVLGDNVMIAFPVEHTNTVDCPGTDATFIRTDPLSWWDPSNWCEVASPGGACLASQPLRFDTEKVPCQYDDVVFPDGSSFLVDLGGGVDVFVNSMRVGNKDFSTDEFRTYLSGAGSKQFSWSGAVTFTVKDKECSDPEGCVCGNDDRMLQEEICNKRLPDCPVPQCDSPLELDGQCCPICGGTLEMEYDVDFKFSTLYNALNYQYKRGNTKDVEFVMTRSSTDRILVMVMDDRGGQDAAETAFKMAQIVNKDIKGPKKYRITDITYSSTGGDWPSAGAITDDGRGMGNGSIAGIVLACGAILAIIIICMICFVDKRQWRRMSSKFQRFGSRPDEDQEQLGGALELGPSSSFKDTIFSRQLSMDLQSLPRGFDNPMYSSPGQVNGTNKSGLDDNANANPASEIDLSDVTFVKGGKENTAFDNPLYGTAAKAETLGAAKEKSQDEGFSNPMYSANGNRDLVYDSTTLKLNPVYSEEGIEEDSTI